MHAAFQQQRFGLGQAEGQSSALMWTQIRAHRRQLFRAHTSWWWTRCRYIVGVLALERCVQVSPALAAIESRHCQISVRPGVSQAPCLKNMVLLAQAGVGAMCMCVCVCCHMSVDLSRACPEAWRQSRVVLSPEWVSPSLVSRLAPAQPTPRRSLRRFVLGQRESGAASVIAPTKRRTAVGARWVGAECLARVMARKRICRAEREA